MEPPEPIPETLPQWFFGITLTTRVISDMLLLYLGISEFGSSSEVTGAREGTKNRIESVASKGHIELKGAIRWQENRKHDGARVTHATGNSSR